ncbi:hypothetical protein N665_0717s0006 [Sinapis alba]|nr:hypothetical protein N665_0717s0006 [Sinapis alba]
MNITQLLVVVFIAAFCDNVGASQPRGMHNDTKLMDQKLNLEDIGNISRNIIIPIIDILGNNTRPINITMPTSPNNTSPAPSSEDMLLVEIVPSLAPQGEAPLSGVPSLAPEGKASNSTDSPLSGGTLGVAPSPIQEGGAINGTEPPLSGGILASPPSPISVGAIGVAPSLPPIDGVTEPPHSGGIIEFSPPPVPQGGARFQAPLIGGTIGVVPPPQSRETLATNDIESSIVVNVRMAHVSREGGIIFTTNNVGNEDGSNGASGKKP